MDQVDRLRELIDAAEARRMKPLQRLARSYLRHQWTILWVGLAVAVLLGVVLAHA